MEHEHRAPHRGAWAKTVLLIATIAPAAVVGSFAAARAAGVTALDPSAPVTAAQVNANFAAATTAQYNGDTYSVGPTLFCGATPPTTPFVGGYHAAKLLCESACGNRPAHVCTISEVVRSAQLGMSMPEGWTAGSDGTGDCMGWAGNSRILPP